MILAKLTGEIEDRLCPNHYEGDVEVVNDTHRVWNGCYVSLMDETWVVQRVYGYEGELVFVLSCTTDHDKQRRVVSMDHPDVNTVYPSLGYFNLPTSALYLARKVARQWKQGIAQGNVDIDVPFGAVYDRYCNVNKLWGVGVQQVYDGGFDRIMSSTKVHLPIYSSFSYTMERLTEGRCMSRALSTDVCLALHPANGEIHILYHNISVGALRDNLLHIRPAYQWVSDTLEEVIPYDVA